MPDFNEMLKCPLCGAMPKLLAYREGVWVDVSCSNPVCNKYNFSFRSIKVAVNNWNDYVRSTKLSMSAQEMYNALKECYDFIVNIIGHDCEYCSRSLDAEGLRIALDDLFARIDGKEE